MWQNARLRCRIVNLDQYDCAVPCVVPRTLVPVCELHGYASEPDPADYRHAAKHVALPNGIPLGFTAGFIELFGVEDWPILNHAESKQHSTVLFFCSSLAKGTDGGVFMRSGDALLQARRIHGSPTGPKENSIP